MKKIFVMVALVLSIGVMVGCGSSEKKDTTEEQAQEKTSQLQEEVSHMEEDYKNYVENMGIDVNAALEEAGR